MTEGFNDWWNSEVEQAHNPYEQNSAAYWAWLGWVAGAAHEREKCAKVCENLSVMQVSPEYKEGARDCAEVIRAREGA